MSFILNELDTNLRLEKDDAIQCFFFHENTVITTSTLDKVQLWNNRMNIIFGSLTQQMALYLK